MDKRPDPADAGLSALQQQNIQAVLDLLEQSGKVEATQESKSTSVLTAFHLITSALEGEESCYPCSLYFFKSSINQIK